MALFANRGELPRAFVFNPLADLQYLRPTYPGQLHTVRKNTWNVIMVLDFSLSTTLETVTQQIAHMVQRGIPIRFGVIPMSDSGSNDICMSPALPKRLTRSYTNGEAVLVQRQDVWARQDIANAD